MTIDYTRLHMIATRNALYLTVLKPILVSKCTSATDGAPDNKVGPERRARMCGRCRAGPIMNDAWSIGRGTPKIASKDIGLMIWRLPKIGLPQNHPELDLFSIESHDCGDPP